jgi:hypothetical protein
LKSVNDILGLSLEKLQAIKCPKSWLHELKIFFEKGNGMLGPSSTTAGKSKNRRGTFDEFKSFLLRFLFLILFNIKS